MMPIRSRKKLRKARTDPDPLPDSLDGLAERPEARNLVNIYAALADMTPEAVVTQYAGQGFGTFKPALADLAVEKLAPINAEMSRLMQDVTEIDRILGAGGGARQCHRTANLGTVLRHRGAGALSPMIWARRLLAALALGLALASGWQVVALWRAGGWWVERAEDSLAQVYTAALARAATPARVAELLDTRLAETPRNWHVIDALLAENVALPPDLQNPDRRCPRARFQLRGKGPRLLGFVVMTCRAAPLAPIWPAASG